mgnify:FL=1
MPNRLVYNDKPNNLKVEIYGSDLNQSIETNQKGVSITGILSLDAQDPPSPRIF